MVAVFQSWSARQILFFRGLPSVKQDKAVANKGIRTQSLKLKVTWTCFKKVRGAGKMPGFSINKSLPKTSRKITMKNKGQPLGVRDS